MKRRLKKINPQLKTPNVEGFRAYVRALRRRLPRSTTTQAGRLILILPLREILSVNGKVLREGSLQTGDFVAGIADDAEERYRWPFDW
ncbi:hypothetical protein KCP78_11575 [Salmonella enterica subsp. enterica]|nr:hypothetical protein KCP78_11575 [Salmonella enterica subsp. enterica]